MSTTDILEALKNDIVNLDFDLIVKDAKRAMDAGIDPLRVITDSMGVGMQIVGEKFESGEYFLSDLIVAGAVMKEGMEVINPHITDDLPSCQNVFVSIGYCQTHNFSLPPKNNHKEFPILVFHFEYMEIASFHDLILLLTVHSCNADHKISFQNPI